jgi:hypothetical protein
MSLHIRVGESKLCCYADWTHDARASVVVLLLSSVDMDREDTDLVVPPVVSNNEFDSDPQVCALITLLYKLP